VLSEVLLTKVDPGQQPRLKGRTSISEVLLTEVDPGQQPRLKGRTSIKAEFMPKPEGQTDHNATPKLPAANKLYQG
jgi:hypothetical protein